MPQFVAGHTAFLRPSRDALSPNSPDCCGGTSPYEGTDRPKCKRPKINQLNDGDMLASGGLTGRATSVFWPLRKCTHHMGWGPGTVSDREGRRAPVYTGPTAMCGGGK